MTENQNTNQELSFTSKQLTAGMKKIIEMQGNSLCLHTGLTHKELYYSILTEFIGLLYDEEDKKNQRYQEYIKLKAEFECTEPAPVVKEEPKDSPWYPDDSGEWVEVEISKGKPLGLDPMCKIEYLLTQERTGKQWKSFPMLAGTLTFENVVAYKKVR